MKKTLPLAATVLLLTFTAAMLSVADTRPADKASPVWHLAYLRVQANMVTPAEKDLFRDSVTLSVAGIDKPFQIYLNGQKIGEGDAVANEPRRRFKVPKGILVKDQFNVLAIRTAADTPIAQPPILAGYFDEVVMDRPWDVVRGDLTADDARLKAVKDQPKVASYTESDFRPSSTPLNANAEFMPGRKMSPEESLKLMKPADGLAVDLLLAEPLVAQPTHLSFDERGRMWVSQYRQYPYPAGLKMISRDKYYRSRFDRVPPAPPNHDKGRDIISVHESTKRDGVFDRHKVVLEGLNMANAAVYGQGGIWVMHTPYLLFYPDADGDDIPDRDPEVRLAGFGLEDTHSVANGLAWGPDGWLYGGQGSTTTSRVTRPGIDPPEAPGVYFEGCMVWRYHPTKKIYEIFAEGGGNTFGLDFDAEGRVYSGHNGGVTHGWHFVQSGIYLKQGVDPGKFGPPANPYTFGQLPMMKSRNPIPRFTHAIVMFEGTALPENYLGKLMGADPLHRTVVSAERYPIGSTFETSTSGTPLAGDDIAFRPVYLANAPDGSLYVADFYEEFIAHGQNYQGQIDPTTGRIYRVRGKDARLINDTNLAARPTNLLVSYLSHANRWHRQTAARVIGDRLRKGDRSAVMFLKVLLEQPAAHPALEALWALHQGNALDEATTLQAMNHPAAAVRAWAVRLPGDERTLSPAVLAAVQRLAANETDAEVRAQIASTARRLPPEQAIDLVATLIRRDEDAKDAFIPLLCWWTLETHFDTHREAVLGLLKDDGAWNAVVVRDVLLPRIMRRLAAKGTRTEFLTCAELLRRAPQADHRQRLVSGFEDAFVGRALPSLPKELAEALAKSGLASPALRVRLGEPQAIDAALTLAADPKAKSADRLTMLALFGEVDEPRAKPVLLDVAASTSPNELRRAALGSLLRYDDPGVAAKVAGLTPDLPVELRPSAINLLGSRPATVPLLLKLLESGGVKPAEVPHDLSARLKAHPDKAVADRANRLLSTDLAPDQAARRAEIDRLRKVIAASPGDPYKGEPLYLQRCGVCHTLFFKGGKIGPDLTAYQRDDLGTMLTSIVEPSAEIREGFRNHSVKTKDGRELSGFLVDSDTATIAIRGFDGQDVRVSRDELVELKPLESSLMPEGLLGGMSDQEIRDLFAYLRIPQPITR